MAVSFVARKCTQCAGKLQYIKEKKIWKCLYCGAEIEKQEQYDGLFTIKNVVRQSLLDTAYRRLDSAFKNLIECEKIDSRYVGTVIAKLAYDVTRVITPGACDQKDVKSIFAQLRKTYEQLKSTGATISDDEEGHCSISLDKRTIGDNQGVFDGNVRKDSSHLKKQSRYGGKNSEVGFGKSCCCIEQVRRI